MSKFLIWFQHRSGSTHLVSLLNSHPEIHCRGEMFGCVPIDQVDGSSPADVWRLGEQPYRRVLNLFPGRVESPDAQRCVGELAGFYQSKSDPVSSTSGTQKILGFKFKFPSQSSLFPEIGDWLQERESETKIIVLHRRNYLRRALSVMNLSRVQSMTRHANIERPIMLPPTEFDVREVIRLIEYYAGINSGFRDWPLHFSRRLHVEYQDLTEDPERIVTQIQKFLNVDQVKKLSSKTCRISPQRLEELVSNLDELKTVLADHGWGEFLL